MPKMYCFSLMSLSLIHIQMCIRDRDIEAMIADLKKQLADGRLKDESQIKDAIKAVSYTHLSPSHAHHIKVTSLKEPYDTIITVAVSYTHLITRLCSICSSFASRPASDSVSLFTGILVHPDTTSAISFSPTTGWFLAPVRLSLIHIQMCIRDSHLTNPLYSNIISNIEKGRNRNYVLF